LTVEDHCPACRIVNNRPDTPLGQDIGILVLIERPQEKPANRNAVHDRQQELLDVDLVPNKGPLERCDAEFPIACASSSRTTRTSSMVA
jgi:hypothetical protein